MMNIAKSRYWFVLFILSPVCAWAQERDTAESQYLGEVTVSENRFKTRLSEQNRNITILSQSQIKQLPVRSITELLAYVGGIDLRQRGPVGTQADVSIDGGTFDQTLVLVNGVRMSDPQTGHNMMNLPITLDVIDHVEILRGAAARIYGINTLTGAINFVTRVPHKNELMITGNSGTNFKKDTSSGDNYISWGGRVSGGWATAKSNHLAALSMDKGNGFRYNTAYKKQKAFYQGQFRTNATDLFDIMAGYVFNKFGANGFYAAPGDKNSEEEVRTLNVVIAYHSKITANWTLRPRLSYRWGQDDYQYIKNSPTGRNLHKTHVINGEINNTISGKNGEFGFSLEYRDEIIRSSNLGDHQRENMGISAEYRLTAVRRLSMTAGGYLNYNSQYKWQFFPGIDAAYEILNGWKLFTNIGTGQRLPTYTDLYYNGPSNLGNAHLEAERSKYMEYGMKYRRHHFNASVSYFVRNIDDFIDWTKFVVDDPWQPSNYSKLKTEGFTTSIDYQYLNSNAFLFKNNTIRVAYTNLQPKITYNIAPDKDLLSRYAVNSLRDQLILMLGSDLVPSLRLSVDGRFQKRISYKEYFLLDARLSYTTKRIVIFADGTNLLNKTYVEAGSAVMPGIWLNAGLQYRL